MTRNDGPVRSTSDFTRLLVTGFYDGPTEGLAERGSGEINLFRMLDWDDGQDLRIFELLAVPGNFDDVVKIFSKTRRPRWPIWVIAAPLITEEHDLIKELEVMGRVTGYVATTNLLQPSTIWEPSQIPAGDGDWFQKLGLDRHAKE